MIQIDLYFHVTQTDLEAPSLKMGRLLPKHVGASMYDTDRSVFSRNSD
jgi:hypothetical protein